MIPSLPLIIKTSHLICPLNKILLNPSPPNILCFLCHSPQMLNTPLSSILGELTTPPTITTATLVGLIMMASTDQSGDCEDRTEREEERTGEVEEEMQKEEQNSVQGIQSRYLRCPSPR